MIKVLNLENIVNRDLSQVHKFNV